jgi:hypothetical protein
MTDETVKTITDETEKRRVLFIRRGDGNYTYTEEEFLESLPEDEGHEWGWQPVGTSGLFSRLDDAERDALASIDWITRENPK